MSDRPTIKRVCGPSARRSARTTACPRVPWLTPMPPSWQRTRRGWGPRRGRIIYYSSRSRPRLISSFRRLDGGARNVLAHHPTLPQSSVARNAPPRSRKAAAPGDGAERKHPTQRRCLQTDAFQTSFNAAMIPSLALVHCSLYDTVCVRARQGPVLHARAGDNQSVSRSLARSLARPAPVHCRLYDTLCTGVR